MFRRRPGDLLLRRWRTLPFRRGWLRRWHVLLLPPQLLLLLLLLPLLLLLLPLNVLLLLTHLSRRRILPLSCRSLRLRDILLLPLYLLLLLLLTLQLLLLPLNVRLLLLLLLRTCPGGAFCCSFTGACGCGIFVLLRRVDLLLLCC